MGTETRSCPIAASLRIEITLDEKMVLNGIPLNHRVELMVELLLGSQLIVLRWCVDSHYSHEPTCVFKFHVENPFINQSDLPVAVT